MFWKLLRKSKKGPEIRTGNTKDDADIPISEGTEMNITTDDKYKTACDAENMCACLQKSASAFLVTD